MSYARLFAVALLLAGAVPQFASAHFILLEPASWLVENKLGDPQKLGPCGGTSANPGTPSGIVTAAAGGSTLHIKLIETIYHPGFYRVALAVKSRDELPPDPVAVTKESPRGPWSVSGAIQSNPQPPVLADGLFLHHAKPAEAYETDVRLPNLNCEKCCPVNSHRQTGGVDTAVLVQDTPIGKRWEYHPHPISYPARSIC